MTQSKELLKETTRLLPEPSLAAFYRRLSTLKQVSIAEVAGRVRGAGNELILACDMRFGSRERAVFGQPEVGVGAIPGGGAVQHLTRLMGRGRALEALLGADDFPADLAERYGWINRTLPDAELKPFVETLARRIAGFPQAALVNIKQRVAEITLPAEEELRMDGRLFVQGLGDPETQARLKALFAKGLQTPGDVENNFGSVLEQLSAG